MALFKACVEDPQVISRLEDLNLDRISDPQLTHKLSEKEFY